MHRNCLFCQHYSNPGMFLGACRAAPIGTNAAGHTILKPVKSRHTCDKWEERHDARQLHPT